MLPQFLVAGAAKSGSSTLYHYLSLHPEVFMPDEKEPAFFSKYYDKGVDWYESLFSEAQSGQVAGEATVEYMVNPDSPVRIAKLLPDIKLIFILRNPVDRAWSHYWHRVKNGEDARQFDEIMKSDDIFQEYFVQYGLYYKCLKRYYDIFNNDQIKIIILEDAKKDFPATIRKLYSFIGVSAEYNVESVKVKNKSAMFKSGLLARTSAKIRKLEGVKGALPDFLLLPMRAIFQEINKANLKDWEYPLLADNHRKELNDIFAKDVQRLDSICHGVSQLWCIG